MSAAAEEAERERLRRLIRPEGHTFTLEEIQAMDSDEFEANFQAIRSQLPAIGAARNAALSNPKSVS